MNINKTYIFFLLQGRICFFIKKINLLHQLVTHSFLKKNPLSIMNMPIFNFQNMTICTKVMHVKFLIMLFKKNYKNTT
jgi:hypothetical protein